MQREQRSPKHALINVPLCEFARGPVWLRSPGDLSQNHHSSLCNALSLLFSIFLTLSFWPTCTKLHNGKRLCWEDQQMVCLGCLCAALAKLTNKNFLFNQPNFAIENVNYIKNDVYVWDFWSYTCYKLIWVDVRYQIGIWMLFGWCYQYEVQGDLDESEGGRLHII